MTLREILEKLYEEGSFEGEHRDIHPDRVDSAHTEIMGMMMSKEEILAEINKYGDYRNGVEFDFWKKHIAQYIYKAQIERMEGR